VRDHWSIENQLHWSLDVTFAEDRNHTCVGFAPDNLALFRRLALLLLKRETSLKAACRSNAFTLVGKTTISLKSYRVRTRLPCN
jgi:hypothetical protein